MGIYYLPAYCLIVCTVHPYCTYTQYRVIVMVDREFVIATFFKSVTPTRLSVYDFMQKYWDKTGCTWLLQKDVNLTKAMVRIAIEDNCHKSPVMRLQITLNDLVPNGKYHSIVEDGIMGPATLQCVDKYMNLFNNDSSVLISEMQ